MIITEDIESILADIRLIAHELEGKTVLISGGSGFIGKYFVGVFKKINETFEKPCRVISVDTRAIAESDPNIVSLWADVTKLPPIQEKIDYIIHAAGVASPYYYDKYPLETIDSAIEGARKLLMLAQEHKAKFFLFSTSEIYGDPEVLPTPETYNGNVQTIGARACYDESKRMAETITGIYAQKFGVSTNIVRPFNVYGPGMRSDDYRAMPTFIMKSLQGEPLPIYGNGKPTRSFCYITDAMVGFFQVLLRGIPGEVYNVGSDEREISMKELGDLFVSMVDTGATVNMIAAAPGYSIKEPQRRLPDLTKIHTQLGYKAKVSLEEGIKRSLTWAKENYL